uniref:RING-type E3 ubiquitin transferase n=1 Tax=Anopheles epiroticus TaxID=199890 RepID=A0A182PT94_9DIPT
MEKGKDAAVLPVVVPLDNAAAAQIVCRFYQIGACRFGTSCRFIHPVPDEPTVPTLGSSCASSNSSSSSSGGSSSSIYQSCTSKIDSPVAGSAAVTKPTGGAPNGKTLSKSTIDPSRWIDAPVFVPKANLTVSQQQPATQPDRKSRRKAQLRKAVPDELEEEEEDELEEEEVEELDEDERNNEADNEEEEEEEEEQNEQEQAGAVGGRSDSALLSYANVVTMNNNHNGTGELVSEVRLCIHFEKHGLCPLADCVHLHGELCELCHRYCLDPRDTEQQRRHNAACIREHELEMEHAFAVQRSRDKSCGICLEVVMEKRAREQRFGILPNCKHTFCLSCIRTWRKATNFANKIKRGCPTCRIPSDFVCPSFVWVEAGEEKDRLIENYKQACNNTDCMHFKKGAANCPFGNKCFYRHALPSGELVDLGAPSRRRNPHRGRSRDMSTLRLQEIFASLLAPRGWAMEEFMTTLFSDDLEDDSDDDLDIYTPWAGDSSDWEDDLLDDGIL